MRRRARGRLACSPQQRPPLLAPLPYSRSGLKQHAPRFRDAPRFLALAWALFASAWAAARVCAVALHLSGAAAGSGGAGSGDEEQPLKPEAVAHSTNGGTTNSSSSARLAANTTIVVANYLGAVFTWLAFVIGSVPAVQARPCLPACACASRPPPLCRCKQVLRGVRLCRCTRALRPSSRCCSRCRCWTPPSPSRRCSPSCFWCLGPSSAPGANQALGTLGVRVWVCCITERPGPP